jgi:hypothetical protein
MPHINTARNHVRVYPPEPGHDAFVVTMIGQNDGSNVYRRMGVQYIDGWQEAVDWAVGMADQMVFPIVVAAIGVECFIHDYGDNIERALATMSDAEQAALRQEIVTACAEALRDCSDPQVRADAYDVLVRLGVFPGAAKGGDGHNWEPPQGRL